MSIVPNFKLPFVTSKKTKNIPVEIIKEPSFSKWIKDKDSDLKALIKHQNFAPKEKKSLFSYNDKGEPKALYVITGSALSRYEIAGLAASVQKELSKDTLSKTSFSLKTTGLNAKDIEQALIGWGLHAYNFDRFKAEKPDPAPKLVWPDKADKKRVQAFLKSKFTIRELVNLPANVLGPVELEKAIKQIGKEHKAKVSVIADKKLLEKNFPLVYTVGAAGDKGRRPRLIDLKWGKKTHPKLTLVGKGVVFDTGGLNLKPGRYMDLMKKDMGGAAHALALANLVMSLKLPVQLRLIIPAVENAVASESFRPSDIIKSRKGLFVENINTDAEGRLILADALAYACEDEPDLLIDFATLTGSARAALGHDIPAMFSTDEDTAEALKKISFDLDDPLWPMPLYEKYNSLLEKTDADVRNGGGIPGDLIYSALFLKRFIEENQHWIHLDLYAWENNGRPGRSKGGSEMGIDALYALLEKRYG